MNADGGKDEQDLQSPAHFRDSCPKLTHEQLRLSTSQLYEAKHPTAGTDKNDKSNFVGKYAHLRTQLDYSYHRLPNKSRQMMQDALVDFVLSKRTEECKACHSRPGQPMAFFTAGAMASGKGHTLRHFLQNGQVSLPEDFIWVDPDKIARQLPEREQYLAFDVASVPEKVHEEASMLQEILSLLARETKRSLVIDGSLRNGEWAKFVMSKYKEAGYAIEIFFVFADLDVMEKRAKSREKKTGRQTDMDSIRHTAQEAPKSVQSLTNKKYIDRIRIIDNSSDSEPPRAVYDSKGQASFEDGRQNVDVMKWVQKAHRSHKLS